MSLKNYLLFLLLPAFWGGSFIAIKSVVGVIPPIWAASTRVILAFVFLAILYKVLSYPFKLSLKQAAYSWLTSVFSLTLPFSLLFWGEQYVSAGLAGVINGTAPIWTMVLGRYILKADEGFSWRKSIALFLGMAGLLVIFMPKIQISGSNQEFLGMLAIVGMAISYAMGTIMNRIALKNNPDMNSKASVFHQMGAGALGLSLCALLSTSMPSAQDLVSWFMNPAIIYMGVFSTALAYIFYFSLIKNLGAVRASAVAYLVPVAALALDALIHNSVPNSNELLGCILIFTAIASMELKFSFVRRSWCGFRRALKF